MRTFYKKMRLTLILNKFEVLGITPEQQTRNQVAIPLFILNTYLALFKNQSKNL